MPQHINAILHGRYPAPSERDGAFLQQYWDQLTALGEQLDQDALGPAEIAITYDPTGAVGD
ncbi:MAG: hypothetical protein M3Y33_02100 [Actinomycetota bacterium]|nr:hypothetical protein [Actinomycetota bacterium]